MEDLRQMLLMCAILCSVFGCILCVGVNQTETREDGLGDRLLNNSGCPDTLISLDNKTCLWVISDDERQESLNPCYSHGASKLDESDISSAVISAIKDYHQSSTVTVIRVGNKYWDATDWTRVKTPIHYNVPCLVEKDKLDPPVITSFYLDCARYLYAYSFGRRRFDLLNTSLPSLTVHAMTGDFFHLTCKATGYPQPKISIKYNNTLRYMFNTERATIATLSGCKSAGIYECVAENQITSTIVTRHIELSKNTSISLFSVHVDMSSHLYSDYRNHNTMRLTCEADGCPEPKLVTIADHKNQTVVSAPNKLVERTMTNVTCSDMGTYYCRVEGHDGKVVEHKKEASHHACAPIQLCYGESKERVISAPEHESVKFQVCLTSSRHSNLSWVSLNNTRKISVNITRRWSDYSWGDDIARWNANVTISNVEGSDNGKIELAFSNGRSRVMYPIILNITSIPIQLCHGERKERVISAIEHESIIFHVCLTSFRHSHLSWVSLNYTQKISVNIKRHERKHRQWSAYITISNIERSDNGKMELAFSDGRSRLMYPIILNVTRKTILRTEHATGSFNPLYIILPFGSILAALLAVFVYQQRGSLFNKLRSCSRRFTTSTIPEDNSTAVKYRTLKGFGAEKPSDDKPEQHEEGTSIEAGGNTVNLTSVKN